MMKWKGTMSVGHDDIILACVLMKDIIHAQGS
jgi:hypothetical protein